MKWENGKSYYGEWSNHKAHGFGFYLHKDGSIHDGDVYVGQYKDGTIAGNGTYFFNDGTKKQGFLKRLV